MEKLLSRLSLPRRFAVGIAITLLPIFLLVAVAVGFVKPFVLTSLEHASRVWAGSYQQIQQLENLLHQTIVALDHALIYKHARERDRYLQLREEVNQAFARLESAFAHPAQQQLLVSARAAWQRARTTGAMALSTAAPDSRLAAMESFDADLWRAIEDLEALKAVEHGQAESRLTTAVQAVNRAPLVFMSALSVALVLAALAAWFFARSVLRPVALLRRGAQRLGSGDLAHRVPLARVCEFGELAHAFNTMATHLQQNRTELQELSIKDELTGAVNYRGFQQRLADELKRAQRYETPISMLMLDLDYFKAINDTHGHPAGDQVLRMVAALLRERVRPTDLVARYGGEEFAVILVEAGATSAHATAERIRRAIAELRVEGAAGETFGVTVSIGVASESPTVQTFHQLVAAADAALYEAKRGGRNRVCGPDPIAALV